jgi:hypothetical protein
MRALRNSQKGVERNKCLKYAPPIVGRTSKLPKGSRKVEPRVLGNYVKLTPGGNSQKGVESNILWKLKLWLLLMKLPKGSRKPLPLPLLFPQGLEQETPKRE